MVRRVVLDEEKVRGEFLQHNAELAESAIKSAQKELKSKCRRQEELSRLMQVAYEDRVKGMISEDICIIIIGGHPKHTGKEREIEFVYKVDIASVLRYKLNQ